VRDAVDVRNGGANGRLVSHAGLGRVYRRVWIC
jgi:hypothetical protein